MFPRSTKQMSFIFAVIVQPYTFRKLSLLPALKILPQTLQKINTFISYSLLSWPPLGKGLKSVILKFLLPNKSHWALNNSTCIDCHFSHTILIFFFSWVLLRQSFRYFPPILVFKLLFSRLLPDSKKIGENSISLLYICVPTMFQTWDKYLANSAEHHLFRRCPLIPFLWWVHVNSER